MKNERRVQSRDKVEELFKSNHHSTTGVGSLFVLLSRNSERVVETSKLREVDGGRHHFIAGQTRTSGARRLSPRGSGDYIANLKTDFVQMGSEGQSTSCIRL